MYSEMHYAVDVFHTNFKMEQTEEKKWREMGCN